MAGLDLVLLAACGEAPPAGPALLRLALPHPAELVLGGGPDYQFGLALAPDGRRLVFPAARDGEDRKLYLRDLRSDNVAALAGTEGAVMPFWSPDGTSLGFFANGKMRALEIASGGVRDLADAASPRGGAWLANGEIVFAPAPDGGLVRRGADGKVTPFTSLDDGEISHRLPQPFGDGLVVFYVRAAEEARRGIWIAHLGDPASRRRLTASDSHAIVVDHVIVHASSNALLARAINRETLTPHGTRLLLGKDVGQSAEHELFATAGGDILIYGEPASQLRTLRWVDGTGRETADIGEAMHAWDLRVAPSGLEVAVARMDPQLNTLDIWTYQGARPVPLRLSPSIAADEAPVWSRDGSRIAWISGRNTLVVRDARAQAPETTIRKFHGAVRVTDWSASSGAFVVTASAGRDDSNIIIVPSAGSGSVLPYARTPFRESGGVISPDGRWLAYVSYESGHPDIYVDAFPTPRARARLTVGGGEEPRWSRDGERVFFRRGSELHVVTVRVAGAALEATASNRLFDAGREIRAFDVAPDGRGFLLNLPATDTARHATAWSVLVNFKYLLPSAA